MRACCVAAARAPRAGRPAGRAHQPLCARRTRRCGTHLRSACHAPATRASAKRGTRLLTCIKRAGAADSFLDAVEDSGGEGPDPDADEDYSALAAAMGDDSQAESSEGGDEDDAGHGLAVSGDGSDDEGQGDAGAACTLLAMTPPAHARIRADCLPCRHTCLHDRALAGQVTAELKLWLPCPAAVMLACVCRMPHACMHTRDCTGRARHLSQRRHELLA